MTTGGVPVPSAGAGQVAGEQASHELRRGAVGFGGVLFQSITFMAPAIATAFSIPIGMEFAGYASTVFYGPSRMLGFVNAGSGNPWQNVLARSGWGTVGYVVVFFALLNSVIANQNAANNSSTRNLFAMGRIRLLPAAFALLTRRFRAPYIALVTQLLITIGVALWLGEQYTPLIAFELTATIIVDIFVPLYILLNLACIVYFARYRRAEFNWLLHGVFPVLGIAAFVPAFFAGAGIPVFSFITPLPAPLSYAGPAVGVWMVLGIIYMAYLYVRHPSRIAETRRVFIDQA